MGVTLVRSPHAGTRGAPDFERAVKVGFDAPPDGPATSPTRHWAAFQLHGVGR